MGRVEAQAVSDRIESPSRSRSGLRAVALVLTATAFPVISLVWASQVARQEVERRALAGLAATAKATVLQEQQAWDDAVRVVVSAASRPVPLNALELRDTALAGQGVQNILITGPFADVRLYGAFGDLIATAAVPGITPTPVGSVVPGSPTIGEPVSVGSLIARQVSVPAGPGGAGRLVVDVDMTQLLGKPSDLGFGRTGAKFLVTRAGLIVAGSDAVGTPLRAPENLDIAAAGKPVTTMVFSPFFGRQTVESYEPVPGQNLGILVQQARSEVMAGADRLAALLAWVALAVGLLGATVAAFLGVILGRRSRRLAASEQRLVESERASRRRLEQFLDAIPIGVLVATPDGRPSYANREAERLLGRGLVDADDTGDFAETYGAVLAGTREPYPVAEMPLARALSGESTHAADMEIARSDATVPVEVWATPVLASDGSVEFGIAAFADVSDRHRAAEEVQFLSAITTNMSEGVVMVRAADSTIAYANGSYAAMFGFDAGELVGRSLSDLICPAPVPPARVVAEIREALRVGGTWRGEIQCLRKDGPPFWCALNVTEFHHPSLGPAWIVVSTDVTARRRAEEAHTNLASIVQASRDAIFAKTLDGTVTSWNHGAEMLFGYSAGDMVGGPIDVLIPSERRDEEEELRGRVAGGLGVEQLETVRLRKDGTPVDVSVTLSPIADAAGTISGIAAICRDVTERNRAEAKFQGLLESAPDAIVVVGPDGLIRIVNRQAEILFGYSRDELLGQPVELLIPERFAARHPRLRADFLADASARAMGANLELAARRRDGSEFPVDISLAPLQTEEGVLVSAAVRDVTERRRAQAALLEREAELALARDQALEASRLKSDFLANMSHEIRTPMNAVIGLTGLLLDSSLSAEQREYLGAVRSAGEALLEIINDLLDFSKIEAGKLRLEVMDFDLRTVVEEVRDLLGADAREKGIELSTLVRADAPAFVRGDPGRVRQVLTNLVGNAIKFSDDGEVAVRVHPGEDVGGATRLRFEVTDTGIGIPPDAQRQLFQAFEQVDTSASRRHGGTGLGLAISKQLVEMMGGEIGMESTLGAGSTFWFDVPLAVASAPPTKAVRLQDPIELQVHGDARLLVAEDNPVNQLVAVRMLEKLGFRADVAANGSEAVDALMRIEYAAVLMDCQMPEMDGFEATRAIRRQQSGGRRTPVIAMTAAAAEADRNRCFEADMDDYISKPVRSEDLRIVLARWLPGDPSRTDDSAEMSRIPHTVA
ncbi:MAG: PAS domain S-box protein [Acidimicrobiales bacterium]